MEKKESKTVEKLKKEIREAELIDKVRNKYRKNELDRIDIKEIH